MPKCIPQTLAFSIAVSAASISPLSLAQGKFNLESPGHRSFESGVGVIRGWACEAKKVHIVVDDKHTFNIPSGSQRGDTAETCANEGDNGFGMVMFWPNFGLGAHKVDLFLDDKKSASHVFHVAAASATYNLNLSKTATVNNFPRGTSDNRLKWSTPLQNFILVKGPSAPDPSPNPGPGSGDPTGFPRTITLAAGQPSVTFDHTFAQNGRYRLSITASDTFCISDASLPNLNISGSRICTGNSYNSTGNFSGPFSITFVRSSSSTTGDIAITINAEKL
ncbi:MAG: hypothetical protein OIF38_14555 [Cellvibrionaceae bacterium]|nr:hypothetical protein [Cellvibrionaceae bacterium]